MGDSDLEGAFRTENVPPVWDGAGFKHWHAIVGFLTLKFTIPLEPEGKKEARHTRGGHVFKHSATRSSMQEIASIIRSQYPGEALDGPLRVWIIAYRTRPKSRKGAVYADTKPDYDNIQKLIGDALEGILWVNDSRIVDGRCVKLYAPRGKPGWMEIWVDQLQQKSQHFSMEKAHEWI